ncbi:YlzJ-like family protein [Mesobacillus zeae]|uniref:Ribonuclease n=1 Tax=Mesobacillus zeae TaxID=1917180 RepID=A0A398BFL6_9BACI|nr:YlzJ-like family protein [Mesobacillus zeae]RID88051.1 ribonuclease [Mesobacillus zeae]
MILYTMMPHELVYPPDTSQAEQVIIKYKGIPLVAEKAEMMEYRVIRILSTDPGHFLIPECAPGAKISWGQNECL